MSRITNRTASSSNVQLHEPVINTQVTTLPINLFKSNDYKQKYTNNTDLIFENANNHEKMGERLRAKLRGRSNMTTSENIKSINSVRCILAELLDDPELGGQTATILALVEDMLTLIATYKFHSSSTYIV